VRNIPTFGTAMNAAPQANVAEPVGPAEAARSVPPAVAAPCPECGGELDRAHRAGDGYAPECSYEYCLECGWQGEPE